MNKFFESEKERQAKITIDTGTFTLLMYHEKIMQIHPTDADDYVEGDYYKDILISIAILDDIIEARKILGEDDSAEKRFRELLNKMLKDK